jgi:hypothetical protein
MEFVVSFLGESATGEYPSSAAEMGDPVNDAGSFAGCVASREPDLVGTRGTVDVNE